MPRRSTPQVSESQGWHVAMSIALNPRRTRSSPSHREHDFSRTHRRSAGCFRSAVTRKTALHRPPDPAAAASKSAHIPGCSTRAIPLPGACCAHDPAPCTRHASLRLGAASTGTATTRQIFFQSAEKTDRAPQPPLCPPLYRKPRLPITKLSVLFVALRLPDLGGERLARSPITVPILLRSYTESAHAF